MRIKIRGREDDLSSRLNGDSTEERTTTEWHSPAISRDDARRFN